MDDRLLTIGEAALRLGVSVDTLRRWTEAGDVPVVRTLGGHRRYLTSEIEALTKDAAS